MRKFTEEIKKKVIRLHLQEGRTIKSLAAEYSVSSASVYNWIRNYYRDCQTSQEVKNKYELMRENRKLKKRLQESEKENDFLKKAAVFFAKKID